MNTHNKKNQAHKRYGKQSLLFFFGSEGKGDHSEEKESLNSSYPIFVEVNCRVE